ncbi:hypothetical protein [Micromonospora avicenniae]|uniref:hypothetical protein n=1 Tax=Micromonospora avicenniae TaxID=1198245 RepID=UPI001FE4D799|nr:hypothetical protein [Micromonospora avicenniae]
MAGRRARREPDERPSRAALADGRDAAPGDDAPTRSDADGDASADDDASGDGPARALTVRGPGVAPQPRAVPGTDATPAPGRSARTEPRSPRTGPPAERQQTGPPRAGQVPAPARSRRDPPETADGPAGTGDGPAGTGDGPAGTGDESPARPAAERPGHEATPSRDGDRVPEAERAQLAADVEPTTGAPVDALPRRVPVRQSKRRRRLGLGTDGEPAADDQTVWAPIEEVHWDGTPIREEPAPERNRPARDGAGQRRRARRASHPPDPLPGLAALLALSLVAAFFAWVSAGPLWVALGHATHGTSLITDCSGSGLTQRCRGIFTADDRRFIAHGVRVSDVPADQAVAGRTLPARMTGPEGGTAYADTGGAAHHLRWVLGLLAVAGCGAGIARWTGATRLKGQRARRWGIGLAFAGPALITAGFLVTAW